MIDKKHRRRGLASLALKAALDSIEKMGGGTVEAYPVVKTDQGPNYMYSGTISMFKKEGFKTVAPLSTGRTSTAIMRTTI